MAYGKCLLINKGPAAAPNASTAMASSRIGSSRPAKKQLEAAVSVHLCLHGSRCPKYLTVGGLFNSVSPRYRGEPQDW
jgi:hypothetical protein